MRGHTHHTCLFLYAFLHSHFLKSNIYFMVISKHLTELAFLTCMVTAGGLKHNVSSCCFFTSFVWSYQCLKSGFISSIRYSVLECSGVTISDQVSYWSSKMSFAGFKNFLFQDNLNIKRVSLFSLSYPSTISRSQSVLFPVNGKSNAWAN